MKKWRLESTTQTGGACPTRKTAAAAVAVGLIIKKICFNQLRRLLVLVLVVHFNASLAFLPSFGAHHHHHTHGRILFAAVGPAGVGECFSCISSAAVAGTFVQRLSIKPAAAAAAVAVAAILVKWLQVAAAAAAKSRICRHCRRRINVNCSGSAIAGARSLFRLFVGSFVHRKASPHAFTLL